MKEENNDRAQTCCRLYNGICFGRTEERASVVSGSEVLVLFVIIDREDPARKFQKGQI